MKLNVATIMLMMVMVLTACSTVTEDAGQEDTGLIGISKTQFESEKMEFGKPLPMVLSEEVHFTGIVIPSVDGRAQVSLSMPGVISKIHCKPGQFVNKGGVLFEVSGIGFIEIQQDFAESAAILKRLRSDFERKKELLAENIGTKKEYTLAESEFNAENARYNALKMKLEFHGLDVFKIENGTFYSSYSVKSPIGGFVTGIIASMGQYVDNQQVIAEVVDDKSFQLKLSVFEKDIHHVKPGQTVEFYLAGDDSDAYPAELSSVGKTVRSDTRAIDCFAQIVHPDRTRFVENQFIEGNITVATDSAFSVPETAVIHSENENYVLILEDETADHYFFRKEKITIGRKNSGSVELLNALDAEKMVIKGVYNLMI